MDLAGKTAIVTGGTSGIGLATGRELGARGASVVIAGRDAARGARASDAVEEAGGKAAFVQADLRSEAAVRHVLDSAVGRFGGFNFLFNNAGSEGLGARATISGYSESDVNDLIDLNVKAVFTGMKLAVPIIEESGGGVIVNTASFVGTLAPIPGAVLYGATKAAVVSMTRAAALEADGQKVSIFAVCPWVTDTPMVDRLTGNAGPTVKEAFAAEANPSGKLVTPEEIASVVVSLFDGSAGFKTGAVILADCGPTTTLL